MTDPLLSVIIPVFNGERYLSEAVESILQQDYPAIEIIVVDDGSKDQTRAIALGLEHAVTYIHQANAGPPAARNTGLAAAKGVFIGFLDVDDLWPAGKATSQLAILREDPSLDVVLGQTQVFSSVGEDHGSRFFLQVGCGLYRRRAFDRVGLFRPESRLSDDVDWFTRAREAGLNLKVTDDMTLLYRVHDANITWGTDAHDLDYLGILKRSLDRRRAGLTHGERAPELPPL